MSSPFARDGSAAEQSRPEPVLRLTGEARAFIAKARAEEAGAEQLALFVEVNGIANGAYTYDMWFEALADAAPGDAVIGHDDLAVVVAHQSVDRMRGATLDVQDTGDGPGLVMLNPNAPAPEPGRRPIPEPDLSSPLARRVAEVLEDEVNPQIAMHGGRADLVAVDEGTAYVRLSGGCQGCGLAAVTLGQGISVAIREAVPEIVEVIDVTSHEDGSNPYFQPAKK
ncbi:MAG TPA: NifU family protein [Acidimicrobiales bacterium]|nr:NifU family protein [Acidimicrobiales bacterium]